VFQRQRNSRAHSAHLPETVAPDGSVLAAREVDAGAEVDWPFPLTGFDGWAEPGPEGEPAETATESEGDAESAPATTKSRSKAAKATDPEVAA